MRKTSAFVLVLLLAPVLASAWTLHWSRVTAYTDGAPITDDNVAYTVYADGVVVGSTADNQIVVPNVVRDTTHVYTVYAKLTRQGTTSDNAVLTWVAPKGTPSGCTNLRMEK